MLCDRLHNFSEKIPENEKREAACAASRFLLTSAIGGGRGI